MDYAIGFVVLLLFAAFIYHQVQKSKDGKSFKGRYIGGIKNAFGKRLK